MLNFLCINVLCKIFSSSEVHFSRFFYTKISHLICLRGFTIIFHAVDPMILVREVSYINSPKLVIFNFLSSLGPVENPVTSEEYLHDHNTEILCGPVNLASCFDLSDQSGTVTLTSPKLFRIRGRTLLVHIKALGEDKEVVKEMVRGLFDLGQQFFIFWCIKY